MVQNHSATRLCLAYPNSSNDLLSIFVERGLELLRVGGRLGAITSRTCFFLGSFKDWRKKVVIDRSSVEVIADLGQGVMDDAMVEAAAYVLEAGSRKQNSTVIRAIEDVDRNIALQEATIAHRLGTLDKRLYSADRKTFSLLPNLPFVYWINADVITRFVSEIHFDPHIGKVCQGLSTSDNFRFVRVVWEVPYEDTCFCYYPSDGSDFCDINDPVVQDYFLWRSAGIRKWAFHVMSGPSQPWFAPVTVKVQFANERKQLRNFTDKKGKPKGVLRNPSY